MGDMGAAAATRRPPAEPFADLLDDLCAFSDPPTPREASGRLWDHLGLFWSGIRSGS
jgi:hypothetical protein